MTTTTNLGLTLHDTEVGQAILNRIDANLAIVETNLEMVKSWPSGLVEGTAPGRVVSLASDGQLYLSYDDAPGGQENRMNVVGLTMDTAPAVGEDLRVMLLGVMKFANSNSLWSAIDPNIRTISGAPGDSIPSLDPTYGKIAFLQDGETAEESTQGYVTANEGDSANDIVVGMFLPNEYLLVMPVQYQP